MNKITVQFDERPKPKRRILVESEEERNIIKDHLPVQAFILMILIFVFGFIFAMTLMYGFHWLALLIFSFISGIATSLAAVMNGRNFFGWFIIGVWCGIFGYILVCSRPVNNS